MAENPGNGDKRVQAAKGIEIASAESDHADLKQNVIR
jgi:hypothetical protein